jgi:PAS domain S-box-containing protein
MHETDDSRSPRGDIRRSKDAAAAALLRDPKPLWEAVCRTSGDYIVVVDREGTIVFANRVGDGYTTDQVMDRSMLDFTIPESAAQLSRLVQEVFETAEPRSLETTVRGIGGELLFFSLRLGPVYVAGQVGAVIMCCENILALKNTERKLEHERNLLRRLLEIQERERQLVSYEIHDGLAQYLAGALMHLQACQHACPPAAGHEFDESLRLLQAAAEESRRLISGLRPPALDELGLVEAVESLVDDARKEIRDVSFTHALPGARLPPQLETSVFRIVQEGISNARKHAHARRLRIDLSRSADSLRILVADDGRGFNPTRVPEERFGLEGIRQRSRLLGGEPRITSAPGAGTTIEVVLPAPPA